MSLRYPILVGAPLGGPNHSVARRQLIVSIAHIAYDKALANLSLSDARALLLLHVPRFPFHDSTSFMFCCKTNRAQ